MVPKVCLDLDFRVGGNAGACQVAGWSQPEAGFCWTIGEFSTLRLPAVHSAGGCYMELRWWPAANRLAPASQYVAVIIDGRTVFRRIVTQAETIAFWRPPSAPDGAESLVEFHHPDHIVAASRPDVIKPREVALAFVGLRMIAVDERFQPVATRVSSRQIKGATVEDLKRSAEAVLGGPLDAMLRRFEIIGGNCDLGLALRRFGYESLSLLRFGGATLESARRGLENGFSEIGADIEPYVVDNLIQEWMIRDKAGFLFHTGQSSRTVSAEKIVKNFRAFARRLAIKLMDDIANDEKIFVFSEHLNLGSAATVETIMPVYLALRSRGGSRLLWVRSVGKDSPLRGSVHEIFPGLAIGYLDLVAPPMLEAPGITLAGWLTVLLNAAIHFKTPPAG